MRIRFLLTIVAAAAALTCSTSEVPSVPAPAGLALVGGTLVDGSERAPVRDSTVLIRGDRIERAGPSASVAVPGGYTVIDTEGMTVMPGLWDPHVHLLYSGHPNLAYWFEAHAGDFTGVTMPASAQQLLMAGVTSARDLGAPLEAALAVRKRIASGDLAGPRLFIAGPVIMNGAPPAMTHTVTVADVDEARARVRRLIEAGVDIVKVANAEQLPPGAVAAIVEEAHGRQVRVTAHGRTDGEVRIALAAGVDELQHIGTESPEYPGDIVEAIRTRVKNGGLRWSPTIGAQVMPPDHGIESEYLDDPRNFLGLPRAIVDEVRRGIAAAAPPQADPEVERVVVRKVAQLRELGVDLVFGSDAGGFGAPAGQATWRELDAWVRVLGVTPSAAIREATSEAARIAGAGSAAGTIAAGSFADVIAVRGNPLRQIDVLRDPAVVIRHGRRHR